MNQSEFLEKQWIEYQQVCKLKGMDAGTKEAFIDRNTPRHYSVDTLLDKRAKAPILRANEDVTDTHVGDINVVEIKPLFKIKKGDEFIFTKDQLIELLERAYEAGRQSA